MSSSRDTGLFLADCCLRHFTPAITISLGGSSWSGNLLAQCSSFPLHQRGHPHPTSRLRSLLPTTQLAQHLNIQKDDSPWTYPLEMSSPKFRVASNLTDLYTGQRGHDRCDSHENHDETSLMTFSHHHDGVWWCERGFDRSPLPLEAKPGTRLPSRFPDTAAAPWDPASSTFGTSWLWTLGGGTEPQI